MKETSYHTLAQIIRRSDVDLPNEGGLSSGLVNRGITIAVGIAGAVALIMIVYGGFKYITSKGNPQETAKAQNTIIYGLAGLVVVMFAVAIIRFVLGRI